VYYIKKQLIIPSVLLMVQCGALGGGLDSEGSPYFLTFFTMFPASLEARVTLLYLMSRVEM